MTRSRIRHERLNPHDPNACVVETLTGDQLGFVPRDLAVRLAGLHAGGRWRARIKEVYRNETWGLGVWLPGLSPTGLVSRNTWPSVPGRHGPS